jgi:ABC-type multidrug transport system fused ATPase/permease subunit
VQSVFEIQSTILDPADANAFSKTEQNLNKNSVLAENIPVSSTLSQKADSGFPAAFEKTDNDFSTVSDKSMIPSVRFDHVSLTYQNAGDESLSDLNFSVQKGQTIGIIGGTGSGKSSLVHLIARFYDASAGTVFVNGVDVRKYPLEVIRKKIGIVMQKAVLFQGTLRENLKWGKEDASDEEMWEALELAQAKDFVLSKDGGLDFRISQGGKNLSGGQKQRLTIARALIRKPEILILDDSASALDFATDAKLRAAIKGLGGEMTVFIVSQRASSIQYADQILVLEDGKLAGRGSHEELLENCGVYQEIYYSQFPKEKAE